LASEPNIAAPDSPSEELPRSVVQQRFHFQDALGPEEPLEWTGSIHEPPSHSRLVWQAAFALASHFALAQKPFARHREYPPRVELPATRCAQRFHLVRN
jgi:hypothetical protein